MLAQHQEKVSRARAPAPFLVGALVVALLVGGAGVLAIALSRGVEESSRAVLAESIPSVKAATELELLLFGQKDLTANYLLDGDSRWLGALEEQRRESELWFTRTRE